MSTCDSHNRIFNDKYLIRAFVWYDNIVAIIAYLRANSVTVFGTTHMRNTSSKAVASKQRCLQFI